ncbi:MAG: outer membrane protein assembly factor BamB, partial [Planctomycetota bacterium]
WEGPPRAISHASPTVATLLGVEQFLVMNEGTVSGHSLADGALLWEHSWPGSTPADANNSQPVVVGDGQVLVSKGYGSGSSLLSLKRTQTGDWSVTALWAQRRSLRTKLTTAVVRDGHAFGLSDGMLECISLSDGKRVWKEGRFGHGQLLLVGEHLLILSEEGELLLVEASAKGEGELLGRFPVLEGKTWNTFAMMGELVVLRNGQEAAAVRLPRAEE